MAKIQRTTQKIFAGNSSNESLAAFGSMKTGTPIYTDNIEDLQTASYEEGWEDAIVGDEAPFLEEMNGVQYGFSKQLAYLFQQGMAEWDAGTTYYTNSFCSQNGLIYRSKQDDNINHSPADDATAVYWEEFKSGSGGSSSGSGFSLFDIVIKDHILTEQESVGFALLGTYVTKAAYPDFYQACADEKTAGTETQTQLGDSTITTYNNANGHIFYDIADKSVVDAFYEALGIAWFYGVDTENEQIFLPRGKNYVAYGNTASTAPVVGNNQGLGITDGVSTNGMLYWPQSNVGNIFGPCQTGLTGTTANNSTNLMGKTVLGVTSDPSKSGIVAQTSNIINGKEGYVYMVVGNTVINSDQALIDTQGLISDAWEEVDDKINDGLAALAGASNALTQNQITNCITKIPQRVNVELNNGALTLKAGSVAIVPYGTSAPTLEIGGTLNGGEIVDISWDGEKLFYYVKYDSNKSRTANINEKLFMLVDSAGNLSISGFLATFTGSEKPSSGLQPTNNMWYDTTNNLIKYTSNGGASWSQSYSSLPFCTATVSSNKISSINNIFNGFGFIGSTIWCDKGVKGLAADGRNSDGSLKNIEIETEHIILRQTNYNGTSYLQLENNSILALSLLEKVYFEYNGDLKDLPRNSVFYDSKNNITWSEHNNILSKVHRIIINITQVDNLKVTSFGQPKQPFRAVDYNDTGFISKQASPSSSFVSVALLASGQSYTAPCNCTWCFSKATTANLQYTNLYCPQNNLQDQDRNETVHGENVDVTCNIKMQAGQTVVAQYNAGGTLKYFGYIPDEGAM